MATVSNRAGMGWGTRLLLSFALILAGAAGAAWALARYDGAARFLGVAPKPVPVNAAPRIVSQQPVATPAEPSVDSGEIASLENRLSRVESSAERVEGSAGRADALLA